MLAIVSTLETKARMCKVLDGNVEMLSCKINYVALLICLVMRVFSVAASDREIRLFTTINMSEGSNVCEESD